MKILKIILVAIIAIMSVAAGAAKIMQTPQELEFLQSLDLSTTQIIFFGIVQVVGGLLVALPKTRVLGAGIAIITLAVSTFLIFKSGNTQFGLLSILPTIIAVIVLYQAARSTHNQVKREGTS